MVALIRSILIAIGLIETPDFVVRRSESQPNKSDLRANEVVIVGNRRQPKWAVLLCPGACGHIMRLPLAESASPRWKVTSDWLGRATATPSVHQKNACRAHYWIRQGTVVWCRDTGCGPA